MGVHDCFMSALVGVDESVYLKGLPEFGGEDLTEECPRPQSLHERTFTIGID